MADTTQQPIGEVTGLWRYPVKSMRGEELDAAEVTERGFAGDRRYALIDTQTVKIVSAKNPQKWARLFEFQAVYASTMGEAEGTPVVSITFPDGTVMGSDERQIHEALSRTLGRDVVLATSAPDDARVEYIDVLAPSERIINFRTPNGTFFDYGAIHLLTTASLAHLNELYPQGSFDVRRFRPNIIIRPSTSEKGFIENDWVGKTLTIGERVQLRVVRACPRCVMTTLPQPGLPADAGILRTAAQHNEANVGVYATVLTGGTIRQGDPVRLTADKE